MTHPTPTNSIIQRIRLVCQDRNVCLGDIALSGKTAVTFELMMGLKILQKFEFSKPVKHKIFYDSLHYFLPFGLGGAVNTAEEEKIYQIYQKNNDNVVCWIAPATLGLSIIFITKC